MTRSSNRIIMLGIALAASTVASTFSFSGTFTQDDTVKWITFTVGATSSVTLQTFSYAGGVNGAGTTIARGGFDPVLSLFNSVGALITSNDDGASLMVGTDLSGHQYDAYLTTTLAAGNYIVALTQYDNLALGPNLSNGFIRVGQGNFTHGIIGSCTSVNQFCDVSNTVYNARDGHWAFDISGISGASSIPEPATIAFTALGLAALAFLRRRQH